MGPASMEFISSRPDVVRSNNQRWLCDYWSRARAGARVPAWRGIDDDEFAAVRADLSCSDVAPANGQPRFRIRFHGERVAQLYGRENCIGKFLDEILPDAYREAALSSYRHVLASRLPVYTVAGIGNTRATSGAVVTATKATSVDNTNPGRMARRRAPPPMVDLGTLGANATSACSRIGSARFTLRRAPVEAGLKE